MPTTVEQRAPIEEQEDSHLPNANPETLNYDESGFGELVERVSSGIEVETEEIVGTAGRRVETAPSSVGLDPERATTIFRERGFSARIESIVNRIRSLTQQTRDKIEALAGSRTKKTGGEDVQTAKNENPATAEEKQPRAMTLDFYIRLHTPSGTEYAKYASRLAQLRLLGIRRAEKTYGLIRYLEEQIKANEQEFHTAPKKRSSLLRGDNPKLIEDLCALPNDPVETLEHLRRLNISISSNDIFYFCRESRTLLSIPNIINVLQKIEKTPSVFRIDQKLRYLLQYNTESLTNLAAQDADEHILTEKTMQDLDNLRSLLGFSIQIYNAKRWIDIAGNDALLLLLQDAQQKRNNKPFDASEESMLLERLEQLSTSDTAQVIADLLREGFDLGPWDISSRISFDFQERINGIKRDPSLKKFIADVSHVLEIPPSIDELSLQKFKRCFDYPDALSLLAKLKEMDVLNATEWQVTNAQNWDTILSDQERMKKINNAAFQEYVSTMQRAGGKVHLADLFTTSRYGSGSCFMDSYERSSLASKMLSSEDAVTLARELNVFQHRFDRYQQFSALLDVPHALEKVRFLQQQFNYKYQDTGDYWGEINDLVDLVDNDDTMRDLSTDDVTTAWQVVRENLGIAFIPNDAAYVFSLAHDPSTQECLKDPETSAFIRDVYTQDTQGPRLFKIMVLAQCDASFRPIIRTLREEFHYKVNVSDAELPDADAYCRLRDNPKILDVARELKKSNKSLDPVRDLATLESLVEFDLLGFFIQCEDFPAIKNYIIEKYQIVASIPRSEFPEQLNEILKKAGPIVLCEFAGALLQQGRFEMIAEIANSKESPAEHLEAVERIKKFIETHNVSGKGHTIATLLMMREYHEGEDFSHLLMRVEKNLAEYERIIADREPKNIPKGLRASIGMEYEITGSTAHAYQKSSGGGDLRNDMAKVSQFAGVGRGKDAIFEIATKPADHASLMLLEMKLLHDLGFVDLNFNRPDYERGARGYHLTIGGERAIAPDSKACFLQNALVISGWGGINAGRDVDRLSIISNIRARGVNDASRVFENVEPCVEFRSLSLDTTEPFERAVATCFYGAIAIQTVDKYADLQNKDQLADILREAPSAEQFYKILKKKKLLKETTDDARIKKMIFEWVKLELGAIHDLTDHNENFLQNEIFGYLNDRDEWVDALDFGGAANRERFLAATGSEQALEKYGKKSRIDPGELFDVTSATLANKCTAITNLFIKASPERGGDITNATASLDTTKVGNKIEDSDPRAKYSSVFDTHGRTRQGYYYIQGGSEKMLIHAMQKRLLEFNKAMQQIIA